MNDQAFGTAVETSRYKDIVKSWTKGIPEVEPRATSIVQ